MRRGGEGEEEIVLIHQGIALHAAAYIRARARIPAAGKPPAFCVSLEVLLVSKEAPISVGCFLISKVFTVLY